MASSPKYDLQQIDKGEGSMSWPGLGVETPEKIKYHFSGHETFPFRYAWLPKGIKNIRNNPALFKDEEAIVELGVGKNMVRSIRHWCETLGLISPVAGKRGEYQVTELGELLFGSNGSDPYLENPGTLWLLHWQLTKSWYRASTWYLAFTRWNTDDFSREQLVDWLWRLLKAESPVSRATNSSLKRDVDVFLRTYVPSKETATRPLEDTFDCPLVELGLISEISRNIFQFVRGPKPSLPGGIFIFAVLEFWLANAQSQKALSFEYLMHLPGSPGRTFKFSENALMERLERLPEWTHLTYGDTAGQRMLYLQSANPIEPLDALMRYYNSCGSEPIYE